MTAVASHGLLGIGDVLAALNGPLELAHEQRLRLRRKLPQILSQSLDRRLAHAPKRSP